MSRKNGIVRKILIIIGVCFIASAIILLSAWQWKIHSSLNQTDQYLNSIYEAIPEPQGAVLEEQSNNYMPILSVSETDFVGIIEFPAYNSSLPVGNDWGKLSDYPCRFAGSVYDRTLQIGATSQKGQYDFYRDISVGDRVLFTDMAGNRYSFNVSNIKYSKNADKTSLTRENSALTLFIKNIYSFEYIIVYCNVSSS